jgi:hypothetical protein
MPLIDTSVKGIVGRRIARQGELGLYFRGLICTFLRLAEPRVGGQGQCAAAVAAGRRLRVVATGGKEDAGVAAPCLARRKPSIFQT